MIEERSRKSTCFSEVIARHMGARRFHCTGILQPVCKSLKAKQWFNDYTEGIQVNLKWVCWHMTRALKRGSNVPLVLYQLIHFSAFQPCDFTLPMWMRTLSHSYKFPSMWLFHIFPAHVIELWIDGIATWQNLIPNFSLVFVSSKSDNEKAYNWT